MKNQRLAWEWDFSAPAHIFPAHWQNPKFPGVLQFPAETVSMDNISGT
jgi:hypothetical protein